MNIIYGNILDASETIIVHQVNARGVMGAGLAKQIKEQYPVMFEKYKYVCHNTSPSKLLGKVQIIDVSEDKSKNKFIANVFGQNDYGTSKIQTDYNALFSGLEKISQFAKEGNYSVAIPYGIGCGLAGGDWDYVYRNIQNIFKENRVTLYKL